MVGSTPKNASEMNLQAKLCARTGLRCILGGPPQLNGDPCHGSAGNIDPQALPPPSSSVWGYYLRDEPQRQTFPSLKAQQDRLHAAHPRSLVFVNMDPPGGWFGQGSATPAAEAEYSQYLDAVKPDLLSFDVSAAAPFVSSSKPQRSGCTVLSYVWWPAPPGRGNYPGHSRSIPGCAGYCQAPGCASCDPVVDLF